MSLSKNITVDGNEAVANVAHRMSEVSIIYPITPSSPMGEFADQWSAQGKKNLWGNIPTVAEMQSEGGAAGAAHGALQAGSLATTYTASQGLLLMIPNMYKIAGELTPFVMHVAARTVATHALSIFGDHSDVMGVRQTGFVMLASNSVQEAHDLAAISHAATLELSLPILHFFDGFRTSHEVSKIEELPSEVLSALIKEDKIADFRKRAINPDAPSIRGTAQNPDVFFQAREACNEYYNAAPAIILEYMKKFEELTGRKYRPYEYEGPEDADRVIIMMGSGCETAATAVAKLNEEGEKVGLLKVRMFRPFDIKGALELLPKTVKSIAVLDRTKEPGATGEPLLLDVLGAIEEDQASADPILPARPTLIGGRYGLSSKEFTPAMVKAVFDELKAETPKRRFTVGILDDITHLSLKWDPEWDIEPDNVFRGIFYGLGSDGTVGANKNTIKIIGDSTDSYCQGYFVYDSKKSGAMTTSHLRFGPEPVRSPYLINKADFVGCHQFVFLDRFDATQLAKDEAVFLINAPYGPDEVWSHLSTECQKNIIDKKLKLYTIDALKVAKATGMGTRINTIMQTCFFAISGILPKDEAIASIKKAIEKTYSKKGMDIVQRNFDAVDGTLENLFEVSIPAEATSTIPNRPVVSAEAPDFVQKIIGKIMAGEGDLLPVSAMPEDGVWPTATTQWEKRGIAAEIPIWEADTCIQCNKCALACPHAAIRAKAFDPETEEAKALPDSFQSVDYKAKDLRGMKFSIQVAPDDCTGCNLCTMVCPAKNKAEPGKKAINMKPYLDHVEEEKANYTGFLNLPETPKEKIVRLDVKGSQFLKPLFEYSGACAGCGETPYVKLMTQLFGDRMIIANATGCSSIYGGNLPTTPYCTDDAGRGPAWANSLFEDNAEFGYGMRLAIDTQRTQAKILLKDLAPQLGDELVTPLLEACEHSPQNGTLKSQQDRVVALKAKLATMDDIKAKALIGIADTLVDRSLWILGGDGWAYDIGYGGLDHVLAQPHNVNVLVMDTEVYSNTGGQQSKATPLGAAAKFAAAGKAIQKKDLGLMAMSYGHVYVASVAMGAKDAQTVKAFQEAESYDGPSLIIAYSHCIAHGYDLRYGFEQQTLAVNSGVWPLYRFDPRLRAAGKAPLQLDSTKVKNKVSEYHAREMRFGMVRKLDAERYKALAEQAAVEAQGRVARYEQLSNLQFDSSDAETAEN